MAAWASAGGWPQLEPLARVHLLCCPQPETLLSQGLVARCNVAATNDAQTLTRQHQAHVGSGSHIQAASTWQHRAAREGRQQHGQWPVRPVAMAARAGGWPRLAPVF
jgi:hypothetical protein